MHRLSLLVTVGLLLTGCETSGQPGGAGATARSVLGQAAVVAGGMLGAPVLGSVLQGAAIPRSPPPTLPEASTPPPASTSRPSPPPAVAAAAVTRGTTMRAASAGVCKCADLDDIRHRLREARTAIDAYEYEIEAIQRKEREDGKVERWTWDRYQEVQGRVNEALGELLNWSGRPPTHPGGRTFGVCVSDDLSFRASLCMNKSIMVHEAVHRRECKRLNPNLSDRAGQYWMEKKTLVGGLQEEIEAYQSEIGFLEEELRKLPCDYRLDEARTNLVGSISISGSERALKCGGSAGDWVLETKTASDGEQQLTTLDVTTTFRLDEATLSGPYKLAARYNHFSSVLGCDVRACETNGAGMVQLVKAQDGVRLAFVPDGPAHGTCRVSIPCEVTRVDPAQDQQPLASMYDLEEGSFCR